MYVRIEGKHHSTLTMIIHSTVVKVRVGRVDCVHEMGLRTESRECL